MIKVNSMEKKSYLIVIISLFVSLFFYSNASNAEGGLSLSQTRVVFNAKDKSTKITLNNLSDRVYLISSSVLPTPDTRHQVTETMPFIITPLLFRLEKESRYTVLISKKDISILPTDRESVFYLSFLAIPSMNKKSDFDTEIEDDGTTIQVSFGVRTVIKLFYRPTGLLMPPDQAPAELTFERQGMKLIVHNPTPYYVTLAQLKINGNFIDVRDQGAMISPFSTIKYAVKDVSHTDTIQWSAINEFGGSSELFQWSK